MFEFLAEKTTEMLESKNIILKDRAIYKYGIEIVISTATSTLLLLTVGVIFNCVAEAVLYECMFFILRRYTGGYHCTTHLGCISTYIIFFCLYLITEMYLELTILPLSIIVLMSIIVVICLSPVQSNNKILNELEQEHYRLYSIVLSILIGIICLVLKVLNISLYMILTYSFSLIAILMIGGKISNEKICK